MAAAGAVAGGIAKNHAKSRAQDALRMVAGKPNTKVGGRGVS